MRYLFFALFVILTQSCGSEFLEIKPDKALAVPTTIKDLQALLDDMDQQINQTPGLIELVTDHFTVAENVLASQSEDSRNSYLYIHNSLETEDSFDWDRMYHQVLRTNIVLDGLQAIEMNEGNRAEYEMAKGTALFFRGWHFFNLLQMFSKPYNPLTSDTDLGIVVKLNSDINERLPRSTTEATYKQILSDLESAAELLPGMAIATSRPTLATGYAFLARVHLSRFDYPNAAKYADLSLKENAKLLDYRQLTLGGAFPDVFRANDEVLLYSLPVLFATVFRTSKIDPAFVASYHDDDLRKRMYFKKNAVGDDILSASYLFTSNDAFSGLTTSEMYLVSAEAAVRNGDVDAGITRLNDLLRTRWADPDAYVELTAPSEDGALRLILEERTKELFYRGLRWYDLRRLNEEPKYAKTLERVYRGETYRLEPKGDQYAFRIPRSEIKANPKVLQNQ